MSYRGHSSKTNCIKTPTLAALNTLHWIPIVDIPIRDPTRSIGSRNNPLIHSVSGDSGSDGNPSKLHFVWSTCKRIDHE